MIGDTVPQVERHRHWLFAAFDQSDEDILAKLRAGAADVKIYFPVDVEVVGYETEADAAIGAAAVVSRQHFLLKRVWECAACGFQGRMAQSVAAIAEKA